MKDVVKIPQSKTVARMDGNRVFGPLNPDSWPNERISAASIAVDMASFLSTDISSRKLLLKGSRWKTRVSASYILPLLF